MQKEKHASPSTNYRYKIANKSKELSKFCQFRNQYENYISQSQIQDLKQVYHHGVCGKTQNGNLLVVDRLGAIKINEVNKILDQDQFIGYFNQRMLQISQKILQQREQILWVIDLQGKIMQLASKKVLTTLSKIIENMQTYFPNILYKMYLVNTPMLFDTIWNKFCGQIAEETQEKIVMLSDQLELLFEQVESGILPEFLGGEMPDQVLLMDYLKREDKQKQQNELQQDEQAYKKGKEQQSEQEENEFDFASLKQALSSMKMGGLSSVNQTPLNTEADQN